MHIDVNNAFLSWTAVSLLNQGIKYDIRDGYTVIGGGRGKRSGVVLARSNCIKRLGVKTGETLYKAYQKCSVLRVYPPDFKLYEKMSNDFFEFLKQYTPDVEITSIDECFIDYGKVKGLYGDEVLFANKLKTKIKEELGFAVNIGIGNNKLLAKMASNLLKPDKVNTLYSYEVESKMWVLPVGELFGVGKKTNEKLKKIGIKTIGDLARFDSNELYKYFKNHALKLIESAKGIDNSVVNGKYIAPKGISNSITLDYDYTNKRELYIVINSLVEKVSYSLRKEKKYASVVAIIIRDNKFKTRSHQTKLKNATNITSEINKIAKNLFDNLWDKSPVRLIGVRLDDLVDKVNYQTTLFETIEEIEDKKSITNVVDNINNKYGFKTIKTASVMKNENSAHN